LTAYAAERGAATNGNAKVKNAGWQPFALLRVNLRYDGNFNVGKKEDGAGGQS
jgi:hypothetical protein